MLLIQNTGTTKTTLCVPKILKYENDGKNDYLYACNSQLQPAALVWKELFLLTL